MTQNEVTAIGIAIFVGFALLRRLFRGLGGAKGASISQTARIDAAAQRILKDRQKSGRSSVPPTQSRSQALSQAMAQQAKTQSDGPRASSQRQNAQNQPRKSVTKSARGLSANATPAVTRRGAGIFAAAREPVIQRRR
jgi:hypothetical protein